MEEILEKKPKLNLLIADGSSSIEYVEYLSTEFDIKIINIKDVKNKKDVDLVLFTGGEDVNPEQYGEKIGKYTYINKDRDEKEQKCFGFFKGRVPMLGICRGFQFLNVMNGGKLIQHVDGHDKQHNIIIDGYFKPILITSTHHQMVYPFNLEKDKYELIAYSEFFKSNTHLNGENKEIKLDRDFLEPEIVYYPNTKCLGIQGHPEYQSCHNVTKKICMQLIKKYLFNDNKIIKYDNYEKSYDELIMPVFNNELINKTINYKFLNNFETDNSLEDISIKISDNLKKGIFSYNEYKNIQSNINKTEIN